MDEKLMKLLIALLAEKGGQKECSTCETPQTMEATAARFNETAAGLSLDRIREHQSSMNDRETLRMKMISQTVLKPIA